MSSAQQDKASPDTVLFENPCFALQSVYPGMPGRYVAIQFLAGLAALFILYLVN